MDGNARWARARSLPVLEGHRKGAQALKRTVRHAVKHGVAELTVYAFSTENWSRPREEVSAELQEKMQWAEEKTRDNDRMKLFVAFNYGGRAEIVDAAERYSGGGEEEFAKLLYAPDMGDPDVLIRTSGEQRVSNFLLWQTAYSELYFADVLWPDFEEEHLIAALE